MRKLTLLLLLLLCTPLFADEVDLGDLGLTKDRQAYLDRIQPEGVTGVKCKDSRCVATTRGPLSAQEVADLKTTLQTAPIPETREEELKKNVDNLTHKELIELLRVKGVI